MKSALSQLIVSLLACAIVACNTDTPLEHESISPPRNQRPSFTVATTDTLIPAADAYVRLFAPNKNYGSDDSLTVRSFTSNSANRFSVYVRFDQAAIDSQVGGGQLDSARLEFYLKDGGGWPPAGDLLNVYRIPNSWATGEWTEGGITANCPNDTNTANATLNCPGGVWDTTGFGAMSPTAQVTLTNDTRNWISFNVTADVNAFLADTVNRGWYVAKQNNNNNERIVFWSKEGTYPARLILFTSQTDPTVRPPLPDNIAWPTGTQLSVTSPGDTSYRYRRTVYTVGFTNTATDEQVIDFLDKYDATVIGGTAQQTEMPLYVLQVPDPGASFDSVGAIVERMGQESGVAEAGMVGYGNALVVNQRYPIDTGLVASRSDWFNTQNSAAKPWMAIRAPQAWGCETGTYGGTPVKVGILDFSFDTVSTDLGPSNPQISFPKDSLPYQPSAIAVQHGNRVAGILTAAGDNKLGIAGTIWKTDLHLYAFSRGTTVPQDNLARFEDAFRNAASSDIRVINFSGGLRGDSIARNRFRRALAKYLNSDAKRLFVVAADNAGQTIALGNIVNASQMFATDKAIAQLLAIPAYRSKILVVAAADSLGHRWPVGDIWTGADMIAAPGTGVVGLTGQTGVGSLEDGTSFAAPFVAGVAAQLWTMDPSLTGEQVRDYILNGTRVSRIDPTTGVASQTSAVHASGIYELDAYGSLSLMSKARGGTPICGFPVHAEPRQTNPRVVLDRDSPQTIPISPGVPVPGWEERVALSVAQGGRLLAVNRINRNTGQGAVDEYALSNGAWSLHRTITGRMPVRTYLEKDTVDSDAGAPVLGDSALATTWKLTGPQWGGSGGTTIHFADLLNLGPIGGFVLSARFSPDGAYALVSANGPGRACNSGYETYLVPLPSGTPQPLLPTCVDTLPWYGADGMWDQNGSRFIVGEAWVSGGPDTVGVPTWSRFRPWKIVAGTAVSDGNVQNVGYQLISFYAAGAEGRWSDPTGSFGWWMEIDGAATPGPQQGCWLRKRTMRGTFKVIDSLFALGAPMAECQIPVQMMRVGKN